VDDQTIGKRLRELRKRRGFTQGELADRLGLNQPLVSQYEQGEIRMHAALVAAFAKALKVSSDEILGLKESKENGLLTDRPVLRRLQKMEALSRRDKQALLRTIDGFLSGRTAAKRSP
jgi:transcriptional regulator with XRE-family HTH domain